MANEINIYVNKTDLGLNNVDNTSDLNKPISTATQTALNGKEDVSNKSTNTSLGTSDTLYPTQKAVKTYVDTAVSGANLTLGETSTTAYRGDRGKIAYDHSLLTSGNPHNVTKSDVGLSNVPNTDTTNPANIVQTSSYRFVSDTEKSTWNSKQNALGFTPENISNKSTDVNLGTSNTLYPTQNAVKTYTDNLLGNANALIYKGVIDCSTNPNYPSANAGELYIVSVAGKIGGVSGNAVEIGDMLICNTDSTASGNQATVGSYWNAIQKNIEGYIIGPASSTNNTLPVFDGATGKLLKNGIITDNGTNIGIGTSSPTTKLHVVGDFMVDYAGVTPLRVNNTLVTSGDTTGVTGIYLGDAGSGVNMIQREKHTANSAGINLYSEYGYNTQSLVAKFQYNLTKFYTGAIQRFHITGNGDIGIGDDITPSAKLHVNNTTAANSFLVEDDSNPDSTPFVITNVGDVGIGTDTPATKLDVNGNVKIQTIANATSDTDKFLVSDSGVVKYRTGAELLSDINGTSKDLTLDRKTASYTLVANDNGKMIEMNVASANTLTIDASIFSTGNQILVSQYGAGQTTITAGAGVTLRSSGGKLKTSAQYSLVTIVAISSTEFYVAGDLTA